MSQRYMLDWRWDPDTDINSLGPLERDPSNPSPRSRRRLHRILEMLLYVPSEEGIVQADKILAAYPYLRDEYGPRITAAERALRARSRRVQGCKHSRAPRSKHLRPTGDRMPEPGESRTP
jgi:hypothetical protein